MSRPSDWSPVQMGSDPTPGDAAAVAALARRYSDTAQAIADQAARLKGLQSSTGGQWVGKSGDVFRQHAGDLSDRITKAQSRYEAAASALGTFAREMTSHQADADRALVQAQQAQSTLQSTAPGPPPPPGAPPPSPAEAAQERQRSQAHSTAAGDLSSAVTAAQNAKGDYDNLASRVANQLHGAIQHDGVHDSWWDKVSGWVEGAVKIIGAIVLVLAVIAFVVVTFGIGLSAVLAAALTWSIVGLSALSLALNTSLAATGKGSWSAVAWDAVGLLTAGFGAGAGKLAEQATAIGSRVAAARAGRAVFAGHNLPGVLYSVASRSTTARSVMSILPRGARVLGEADKAAGTARTAVTELSGTTTRLRSIVAGDRELSRAASLANRVNTAVPGVLRVEARAQALQAGARASGLIDGALIYHGGKETYKGFVVEPRDTAAAEEEIARINARYERPTVHVP